MSANPQNDLLARVRDFNPFDPAVVRALAKPHQPAGTPAPSQGAQPSTQRPANAPRGQGNRNRKTLVSLAGTMSRRGMSLQAIEAALLAENAAKCDPPLPEAKVQGIVKWVSSKPETGAPVAGTTQPEPQTLEPLPQLTMSGAEILDWLVGFLGRFVALSMAQAVAVALWVVHTHAMDAADCTPYLAINSAEKQSGKTRLLEVLRLLVLAAWFTGRVTAAVLSRKIDAVCPTLLLDESDAAFNGDETYAEVLRGVINSGYRRGGCVSVCVGKGAEISYSDFSTFCPKAIAGIGKLPDTVADRSIPIRLKRAQRGTVERFRERDAEREAQGPQGQIAAWCAAHLEKLRKARPAIPDAMTDRQADVCEPLLAIADAAGSEWPERARAALVTLCVGAQAEDGSAGVRLLRDIQGVFSNKAVNEMSSTALCDALALIETSPWAGWHKGRPMSPMGLARLLCPFEIFPAPLSSGQARGYRIHQFEESFRLYIPIQGVKVSNRQYSCGVEADCKVSNENPSDTLKNAVSANNEAGSRHLDTLKAGMRGKASIQEPDPALSSEEKHYGLGGDV